VIINRSTSGRFPSSICGVVRQPSQFSFVRGGRIPTPPQSSAGWRTAVAIAHIALDDLADSGASRAMFFHARRVSPGWRNLTRVATVGNHVFYR
jgi:spore germination cell wall hydrolase CwlJ-like protein